MTTKPSTTPDRETSTPRAPNRVDTYLHQRRVEQAARRAAIVRYLEEHPLRHGTGAHLARVHGVKVLTIYRDFDALGIRYDRKRSHQRCPRDVGPDEEPALLWEEGA